MQVITKQNNSETKTLPCTMGALIKVYGKTISETTMDSILRIEMVDRVNNDALSNPIITIYNKNAKVFEGDVYQFLKQISNGKA
jgi:hypothetical protein